MKWRTKMIQQINGKVSRILNTQEIAMNIGTAHGVTVGMYFDVIDANHQNITDPDTGEVLGYIDRPKVRVKVTHAQEKLSVATAPNVNGADTDILKDFTFISMATFGPIAMALMTPSLLATRKIWQKRSPAASIKIGDPVVQVLETSETDNEK